MNDGRHAKKVVQTYVSFSSQDRNRAAWNDSNNYQIDIPQFRGVSAIRLASFEMPQLSQYTTESLINDTLHLHEGCIIGCADDVSVNLDERSAYSSLHENQVMISYCSLKNEYNEFMITLPAYDNTCHIIFATVPMYDSSMTITVKSNAPHGLHTGYRGNVWLLNGPFKNTMVSSYIGLHNSVRIENEFSFSITVTNCLVAPLETVAILHSEEPSYTDLASCLERAATNINLGIICQFSRGFFHFKLESTNPVKEVRLHYSANNADLSGNPRGIGFSLGTPNKYFTSTNGFSSTTWSLKSQLPVNFEIGFPDGISDIGSIANTLSKRLNSLNTTHLSELGVNTLQMGVSNHLGETFAIRIPNGKYTVGCLAGYMETALASTVGGTWIVAYKHNSKLWIFSSSNNFAFHFTLAAEINSGWSAAANSPKNSNAMQLLSRYFGFYNNSTNYSVNNVLTSVTKSSIPVLMKYPRYSKINDNSVLSLRHTETTGVRRNLKNTYVVGAREPSTRKIGVGCRRHPTILALITQSEIYTGGGTSSLNYADNNEIYHLTIQVDTSYACAPPLFSQVGRFINISNIATSFVMTGQVISMGEDNGTMILACHRALVEECIMPSAAVYPVRVNLFEFDVPSFSLLSECDDSYLTGSIYHRIGLTRDMFGIRDFTEFPSAWNVDHSPAILIRVTAIGATISGANQSSMIQSAKSRTSCIARVVVRSNGIMHVVSNGPQELLFEDSHLSKLHIEVLNSDGTYYNTHNVNHNISFMVHHAQ